MINKIEDYLMELYPDSRCELNYNKDYELLIAVVLSAQTTDKRVNQVTSILFNKYKEDNFNLEKNINDKQKVGFTDSSIIEIIKYYHFKNKKCPLFGFFGKQSRFRGIYCRYSSLRVNRKCFIGIFQKL